MPFTLAHPAIVVPLARWRVWSLAGLVAGSMSPDFEYFVWLQARRTVGHELGGVLLMCIPASLALIWLFDRVLKAPLIALLPSRVRVRLGALREPVPFWPMERLVLLVISIGIGALSHLAWDGFTHGHGWFVERIPVLQAEVISFGARRWAVWNVLQHGCSAIGLVVLTWWALGWVRGQVPRREEDGECGLTRFQRGFWLLVLGLGPGVVGVGSTLAVRHAGGVERMAQMGVIAAMSALFVCVGIYAAWFHAKRVGFAEVVRGYKTQRPARATR